MKKKRVITACVWVLICIVCGIIYCQSGNESINNQAQTIQNQNILETKADNSVTDNDILQDQTAAKDLAISSDSSDADEESTDLIMIHVCGSVINPGVYSLTKGARVIDAVLAADGFCDTADKDYLNQAQVLSDGQKIYIPSKEETSSISLEENILILNNSTGNDNNSDTEGKIDLNSATLSEFMTLPGIGEAKANSILDYRQEHGRFESIDEIQKIAGIKEAIFDKIKELITVR